MNLGGVYIAVVTPFDEKGGVNETALRTHIDFLISKGVAGIVPCGTTGESATLSWEEHNRVVDIALDQAQGRVQVIAGAGSNNTAESLAAARHAKTMGADAILCITPYYNRPTQEGLFQHFRAIATEVDVPIVVYNVPGRTGVNLLPETLERLCAFPNIVAVKEASGNILQISEIHRRCGDRLTILSGDDPLLLPVLACGGKGVVSVVGNIAPEKLIAMIKAFFDRDFATALALHETLLPLSHAMFIETNPIPVKTAMNMLGMNAGPFRLPLVPMSESNKKELAAVLTRHGFTIR
ncbi:MAG: 4-hydroxy-tetrahydrodipicolinate synthase [Chitinispirillaceae bacterium]|jgi:4-hydroxy-tetrahydrodipicolinate synthase|nr:4-hydroxy-tetrahydrodipicolinate synthase [Chitinispirillaceae bacterium]